MRASSLKPSVLFINRVYPPNAGATGRLLRELSYGFAEDGWTVTVLTTGQRRLNLIDDHMKVHIFKSGNDKTYFGYMMTWLRLLIAARKMPSSDLVITMTDPPLLAVIGQRFSKRTGAKHIHWCQDVYPDLLPVLERKLPKPLMHYLHDASRRAMKSCDLVVAVGRCMAKHLARTGVDASRIQVIANWPDEELRLNRASVEASPAVVANIPADISGKPLLIDASPKFRVLYAGNLGHAHPVETIIKAAQILEADQPDIEFIFVGEGPGYDRLASTRARLGLENLRLLPRQPAGRLKDLMESGDIHLISMKENALGLIVPCKLYAALAVKRPSILIGPEKSETGRVISDYKAGSVIPQGDGLELAETIKSYRLNGDVWFSGHQGAAKAALDFASDASIKSWITKARATIHFPAA